MAAEASRGPGDRPPALCFLRGPSWDLSEGSTCPWLFLPAPECQQPDPSMAPLESGSAPPPGQMLWVGGDGCPGSAPLPADPLPGTVGTLP